MGFRKDFYGVAQQLPINVKVDTTKEGAAYANVDVVPIGPDRFPVITGQQKCLSLMTNIFIQQKKRSICTITIKKILPYLQKWALKPTVYRLPGAVFFH